MAQVFTPDSEAAVVFLACARPNFWRAVGSELVPEMLTDKAARLALNAAKALAQEYGAPPSAHAVVQRLNRWREQGQHKVLHEHTLAAEQLFEAGEFASAAIGEDFLLGECVAVVRKHLKKLHAEYAIACATKDDDENAAKVDDVLDRLRKLGVAQSAEEADLYMSDPAAADAAIHAAKGLPRMDVGISELDDRLGGIGCGQLLTIVGATGAGKSVLLSQATGAAILQGKRIAYASLEVNRKQSYTRVVAGMTGIPMRAFAEFGGATDSAPVLATLRAQQLAGGLPFGDLCVTTFTAQATTVANLRRWVAGLLFVPEIVVVDYGDLLCSDKPDRKGDSGYLAMRDVWEALRLWAAEEKIWIFTAAQMKARDSKGKKQKADTDSAADSMHKGRITDVMLTLNSSEDHSEVDIFVAKNRHGASRFSTGPLPTDFECGRLVAQLGGTP